MQHNIEGSDSVFSEKPLNGGAALRVSDILLNGEGAANGADREEIDTDDERADGDALNGDLHPTSGGGAEIEDGVSAGEEGVLGIELDELEGGTRTEALFLGEMVELVQTMLSLDLSHGVCESGVWRETTRVLEKGEEADIPTQMLFFDYK